MEKCLPFFSAVGSVLSASSRLWSTLAGKRRPILRDAGSMLAAEPRCAWDEGAGLGVAQLPRDFSAGVKDWGVLPRRAASAPGGLRVSRSRQWVVGGKAKGGDSTFRFRHHVLHQFCLPFYGPPGGLCTARRARSFQAFKSDSDKQP